MNSYQILRKTVRTMSRCEDLAGFLICILLCLAGTYAMIDSYQVYMHANDNSLLKFKPGYEGEAPERQIQGNMVAWLTIDDTGIDYPVMQGETNDEYLSKDPYGDYSLAGSIFLDARNAPDLSDPYSLIYGHHMEGDYMFGPLHKFLDQEFFDTHRTGELIVGDDTYQITIFAVLESEATQNLIFNPTEHLPEDVLTYVKDHALIYKQMEDVQKDHFVALSTCKYPDSIDRVVLWGYLTEK